MDPVTKGFLFYGASGLGGLGLALTGFALRKRAKRKGERTTRATAVLALGCFVLIPFLAALAIGMWTSGWAP